MNDIGKKNRPNIGDIKNVDEMVAYLEEKAYNHQYYKYYAKKRYIKSIIENSAVYLSDGRNWNDELDSNSFNEDNEWVHYGLCLSFSRSESIAMWMLYSGNDGAMIDYDSDTIHSLIKTETIQVGYFDNGSFVAVDTLNYGEFQIRISDVLYYGNAKNMKENAYYIKRSDSVSQNFPMEIVEQLTLRKKRTAWSYENECRIIVSIKRTRIYSVDPNQTRSNVVKINIDSRHIPKLKKRIYNSPNNTNRDNKYQDSKLAGELNWDLCKDCLYKDTANYYKFKELLTDNNLIQLLE